jgi:LruC domain-containing protein
MKLIKFVPFFILFVFSSCISEVEEIDNNGDDPNDNSISELVIPQEFNFETSTKVDVDVQVKSKTDQFLEGVKVSFHTKHPDFGGKYLASAFTDSNGSINTQIKVPTYLDSLFVQVHSIGFANQKHEPMASFMNFEFGGIPDQQRPSFNTKSSTTAIPISDNYYYMGSYNGNGLPDYLEPTGDNLTQQFLDDVNASLPEGDPVPVANPDYLTVGNELDVVINDLSDVWVTFVTEGAGYRNSLGYYVFDTNNPPANPSQIDSIFVVLPNASLANGGGGELNPGDKIKLGTFEAGKTISWVLFQNAWNGPTGTVGVNKPKFYSRTDFNTIESNPSLRQHTVQLADFGNQRLLNGFEDLLRSGGGSDDDFNDLVFYVSANPWEAIETGSIPQTTPSTDSDGDGINDENDDFPDDPTRALRNTYGGSLAYEDLWPSQGDYDFNDMVIDYDIDHILNGNNLLVDIEADWTIKAVGAGFQNGFGVQFDDLLPGDIASVSGQNLQENIVSTSFNGTEQGQSSATIIFFENVFNQIQSAGGAFINTIPSNPYTTPVTLNTVISFSTPKPLSDVGFPPYDSFIFVNADRGREVHLPGEDATDLADLSLFGTSADATVPSSDYYYKTQNGLPWAINISEPFDYPIETIPVNEAYLNFANWATSGGSLNTDWYLDIPSNRDSTKIYD